MFISCSPLRPALIVLIPSVLTTTRLYVFVCSSPRSAWLRRCYPDILLRYMFTWHYKYSRLIWSVHIVLAVIWRSHFKAWIIITDRDPILLPAVRIQLYLPAQRGGRGGACGDALQTCVHSDTKESPLSLIRPDQAVFTQQVAVTNHGNAGETSTRTHFTEDVYLLSGLGLSRADSAVLGGIELCTLSWLHPHPTTTTPPPAPTTHPYFHWHRSSRQVWGESGWAKEHRAGHLSGGARALLSIFYLLVWHRGLMFPLDFILKRFRIVLHGADVSNSERA